MHETDSRSGIPIRGEIFRKITHLAALVLPFTAWAVGGANLLQWLVPLTLVALLADWLRVRSEPLKKFIDKVFGPMMSVQERPAIGEPMCVNGATWTLISFTVLLIVFEMPIAATAFSVFMVGDAAAALVGRSCGRHRWGRSGCTVEGSVAFFVFGLITALAFGGGRLIPGTLFTLPLWALVAATLAACIAEGLPVRMNDNLLSPFSAAAILAIMLYVLEGAPIRLFPAF